MKINYDALMMEEVRKLDGKRTLLMHSCCGPCSTACIERLKDYFDITVYIIIRILNHLRSIIKEKKPKKVFLED